jgi:hypothetical protein
VISTLLDAHEYAEDTSSSRWDFAVPIAQLRENDVNDTDLRWLVKKGIVDHSCEITPKGKNGRQFRPTGDLTFCIRSCFVLTDLGVRTARKRLNSLQNAGSSPQPTRPISRPLWVAAIRELSIDGKLVKRFKWQAVNQETVLSAFQEDGWPRVIDDPLPPKPQQDSKRRLHDTIKALNRNQNKMRFHGNGTGQGIRWEVIFGKIF